MLFKAGCFFIILVVGSIAFPLNEEEDMSFFFDIPVDPLIIGGVEAAEPVPHMVALTTGILTKSLFCGGSIVNEHYVLSIRAVQCGNSLTRQQQMVLKPHRTPYFRVINHPDYNHDLMKNDIGFLVTTTSIVFTDKFTFIAGGAPAIANGWGRNVNPGSSQNLMELRPVTFDGPLCITEVARIAASLDRNLPPVDPEVELCTFLRNNMDRDVPSFPMNKDEDMSFFFDNPVDPLIVGGTVAEPVAHMVALTTGFLIKSHFCGGSIINERFVLTAAHCVRDVYNGGALVSSLRGFLGSNRWNTGIEQRFSRGFFHPDYNHNIIKNDIGFMVTNSAIVFTDNIQPIVINFDFIGSGVVTIVNGWGRLVTGGSSSKNLMELRPVTVDSPRCVSEVARIGLSLFSYVPPVHPEIEICAFFANATGMCHGDSGSPLILEENRQQIGVVSWGVPCAHGAPDMFARLSAYQSWIKQQLQQTI